MKKIIYALLATLSGIVLLFSYRTSLDAVPPSDIASPASTTQSTSGSASTTTAGTTTGLTDGTFTGDTTQTRYGPVQVQITVSGGKITDAQALRYPDSNGRDQQINAHAIPLLVSETVQGQSAHIQMVSGATYTSDGYTSSLQSAIDQAQQ
ncbi:FMN-binding protein [Microbacterium oxydans]|uniref:FMN-binding protein n=1 Tax=Microbacterium oxydans TaxID=82380 RepID=UPI0024AC898D|nr:FMN-binding protein [Microbacterium oxydans]